MYIDVATHAVVRFLEDDCLCVVPLNKIKLEESTGGGVVCNLYEAVVLAKGKFFKFTCKFLVLQFLKYMMM